MDLGPNFKEKKVLRAAKKLIKQNLVSFFILSPKRLIVYACLQNLVQKQSGALIKFTTVCFRDLAKLNLHMVVRF